jgi:nucleoside-diphosphate-sugar epimerase
MHPNDGRVVSNFIIQALQGKDITIYGTGSQTRSFQYVDDLVNGLMKLMNGNYSQPVNLGNPDEYSVKEFAHLIKEIIQSNSTIKYLPATQDDPRQRKPDITTAQERIGWKPIVPVKVGLEKTIAYFRQVGIGVLSLSFLVLELILLFRNLNKPGRSFRPVLRLRDQIHQRENFDKWLNSENYY